MDFTGVEWRRSSFSKAAEEGGSCIELAFLDNGNIAIRDSEDPDCVPHVFTPYEWECFVAGVHAGEFDNP
ncbi:DUF397 domain-containing protein [Pseudonocardia spinosispora]|uniref:DUF397 domain-containing protein n=1 Tax=Pseudonocardia spinosispora TaxID=103441 RepID=UPI0003F4FDB3|nr:DUF397 domain-containing protein [Pseudonocardia spinosispora]